MNAHSNSMRTNYSEQVHFNDWHTVEGFYKIVQETYRNPHYPGIKSVLFELMDRFWPREVSLRDRRQCKGRRLNIIDLAAGSGEITEALLAWRQLRWPPPPPPATSADQVSDPDHPSTTHTPVPARPVVARPPVMSRQTKVLDVDPPEIFITATDPFTSKAYLERTGRECGELSFQDVAEGKLPDPPSDEESAEGARKYDLVICSYALHLVPSSSELWALLAHLNTVARYLVVIAPHKKPEIKPSWGFLRYCPYVWNVVDDSGSGPASEKTMGGERGDGHEIVKDKTRLRIWIGSEELASQEESG